MLYDGLMRKLALRMNTDFYIIPSSVHELILIPVAEDITRDDLDDMIKSINSTEISKEEVSQIPLIFIQGRMGLNKFTESIT